MTQNRRDQEDAFTGLEAAIVLIAFVVVAAVFSYVVLGAGFFTTQKSQETVYGGVKSATTSFEVVGSVYGIGNASGTSLGYVFFTIGNTAGGTAVDMTKVIVDYVDEVNRTSGASYGTFPLIAISNVSLVNQPRWGWMQKLGADTDSLLEPGEQFVIGVGTPISADAGTKFTITMQPASGAAYPISRTVPAGIENLTILM
jgi:flagellin FlaB